MKYYGIEVKVGTSWEPVRLPVGLPYEFATEAEARTMARVLYRHQINAEPQVVRVVEVDKKG